MHTDIFYTFTPYFIINMTLLSQYNETNRSFPVKCIYHLGSDAGFFSEYNNMILGMVHCLNNRIGFHLYSRDANFGIKEGWSDYFLPFCPEEASRVHSYINKRMYAHRGRNPLWRLGVALYKLTHKNTLLTSDIWLPMRENRSSSLRSACKKMVNMTWRYNPETAADVNRLIGDLHLPDSYAGLHIRGGDKFKEMDIKGIDSYIKKLKTLTVDKNLFILTDDYAVIEELNRTYPEYTIYTLCAQDERGYFHQAFSKESPEKKRSQLIKLFASMDVLAGGEHFIGTFSSNPGMYLGMRMEEGKTHGVDLDEWTIW